MRPTYQTTREMVKYVLIAKKPQTRGDRKFTQRDPRVFGYGATQSASHGLPIWMMGKMPAHITANRVIASAARLTDVRHRWRSRNKTAEMSVPAWPMPIQNTKLVISNAHPTLR